MPEARLRRLSDTLPGLVVERLPSGSHRIRVRVIAEPKRKITIPTSLPDDLFMQAYRNARNGVGTEGIETPLDALRKRKGFDRAIGNMLTGAKQRAALRGCECTITRSDLLQKLEDQGGVCAVTGIEFSVSPITNGQKRPYRMSVDRIERSGGYTPDNIRITAAIANVAMMDWSFDDFVSMCRAVARMHGGTKTRSFRDECIRHRRRKHMMRT